MSKIFQQNDLVDAFVPLTRIPPHSIKQPRLMTTNHHHEGLKASAFPVAAAAVADELAPPVVVAGDEPLAGPAPPVGP